MSPKAVKCNICQRHCNISPGQVGFCQTKKNVGGEIKDLTYGVITGYQIDPIEKKPLYHFRPGSQALSVGSFGCNYRCKQCLNYQSSYGPLAEQMLEKLADGREIEKIEPKDVVDQALEQKVPGIAYTYNEPTIWSNFVYDTAKLAKKAGLFNVFVTNGSWSKQTIDKLAPVIDAANVDLKGFSKKTYQKMAAFWGNLLENLKYAYKKGIFIEITTLIIPSINDSRKELKQIAEWMAKEMDEQTPWHLSQYSPELAPDRKFQNIPRTPAETLEKAVEIGGKAGLKHVYVWPPNGLDQQSTICPQCGSFLIKRSLWQPKITKLDTKNSKCSVCGQKIFGVWH